MRVQQFLIFQGKNKKQEYNLSTSCESSNFFVLCNLKMSGYVWFSDHSLAQTWKTAWSIVDGCKGQFDSTCWPISLSNGISMRIGWQPWKSAAADPSPRRQLDSIRHHKSLRHPKYAQCICPCTCVCVRVFMYVYIWRCVYMCACVCMYICTAYAYYCLLYCLM